MSRPVKHSPAADYEAAAELRETLRRFQRRSEIVARSHGLTARIYQLLLMIKTARRGDGRAGFVELEERLQLGKSTITELVQRSEERGFVRRELDSERRAGITVRLISESAAGRVMAPLHVADGPINGGLRHFQPAIFGGAN